MARWTELLFHFSCDQQAQVEMMALMWRQVAARADQGLNSNLTMNQFNVFGLAQHLDYAGCLPDEAALEWARQRDGYPPPVPWFVAR